MKRKSSKMLWFILPQLYGIESYNLHVLGLHLSSQVCPLSGQYKIRSDLSPGAAVSISSVPKMDLDISSVPKVDMDISSVSEVDMNTKCPSLLSSCTNTHTLTFSHNCGKSVQGILNEYRDNILVLEYNLTNLTFSNSSWPVCNHSIFAFKP